jgi:hypothetical protein
MKLTIATITLAALAGCATAPDQIAASYVSPTAFAGMSCAALNVEAQRLNAKLASATGEQAQQADNDAAMTAVALILFWPAAFFIGGDDQAPAIAQMRGEAEAIRAAARARGC